MRSFIIYLIAGLMFLSFSSCKRDHTNTPKPVVITPIKVDMGFNVNGIPLVFDTIQFQNSAGNSFSVTRLDCYISNIEITSVTGAIYKSTKLFYVSARDTSTHHFTVSDLPLTGITSFKCNIGLSASQNISNSLTPTPANLNMAWPDNMGGGYHFLKLEGHYVATNMQVYGFAMHLGNTQNLVENTVASSLSETQVSSGIKLTMDVAKWFDVPNKFDLNKTNYTMGIDSLMTLLSQNGDNVLSITN